jgi:hypothetical protein
MKRILRDVATPCQGPRTIPLNGDWKSPCGCEAPLRGLAAPKFNLQHELKTLT